MRTGRRPSPQYLEVSTAQRINRAASLALSPHRPARCCPRTYASELGVLIIDRGACAIDRGESIPLARTHQPRRLTHSVEVVRNSALGLRYRMLCGRAHTSLGRTDNAPAQGARITHHDNANPRPHSGSNTPSRLYPTRTHQHLSHHVSAAYTPYITKRPSNKCP